MPRVDHRGKPDKDNKHGAPTPTVPKPRLAPHHIRVQAKKDSVAAAERQRAVAQSAIHGKIDSLTASKFIEFKGSKLFRTRIICSVLSGKAIRIDDIRTLDPQPGLREYEVSFLRLIDKLSNGSKVKVNETGTSVKFTPGVLIGGDDIEHQCSPIRCVGYYLEPMLTLAPFCKKAVTIRFTGCVTNSDTDLSVDIIRAVSIPLLKLFGMGSNDGAGNISPAPEIKLVKRGAPPLGGGEVVFNCPIVKQLEPITLIEPGRVKRVRGVAYTTRCSPALGQRMAVAARGVFNLLIPDVHIYTDPFKAKDAGVNPGYAISIAAETTTGCLLSAQRAAMSLQVAEEMAKKDSALLPPGHNGLDPVTSLAGGGGVKDGEGDETKGGMDDDDDDNDDVDDRDKGGKSTLEMFSNYAKKKAADDISNNKKRYDDDNDDRDMGDKKGKKGGTVDDDELDKAPVMTLSAKAAALTLPETIGRICAKYVMEEIAAGGCIDTAHQPLFLTLMALGPEDVSKIRIGHLSDQAIQTLRLLRQFWGITFNITPDPKTKTVLLSCMGVGYTNMARRAI